MLNTMQYASLTDKNRHAAWAEGAQASSVNWGFGKAARLGPEPDRVWRTGVSLQLGLERVKPTPWKKRSLGHGPLAVL